MHQKSSMLERTAYHEAGHAVARHELGMAIREVSIIPNVKEKRLGYVSYYPQPSFQPEFDSSPKTLALVQKQIMFCYAGVVAEALFCGRHDWRGAGADMDTAEDLAMCVVGENKEFEAYMRWLKIRTRNLMASPIVWVKVEAVAQTLLERKRLSGKETKQIIVERMAKAIEEGWEKLPRPPALLNAPPSSSRTE